jgi:hypothetical protein
MMFLRSHDARRGRPRTHGILRFGVPAGLLAIGICLLVGCGNNPRLPSTHPVRGKVVFRQGGPLSGGTILFQSKDKPGIVAVAKIGEDGSFEVKSSMAGDEAPGAIAGRHEITITPPFVGGRFTMPPIPPQEVTVSEGENNLTLTIDKP